MINRVSEEKELSREYKFKGRIFDVAVCEAALENSKKVYREVICHSGGVCILPVDKEGFGYFVKQYRYGAGKIMLEAPAGKLEKVEEPLSAALRELSEETGFTAGKVISLGVSYSSPAIMTEKIYLYLATELSEGCQHLDTDEFLSVERLSIDQVLDDILANNIEDAKTQIIVMKAYNYINIIRGVKKQPE